VTSTLFAAVGSDVKSGDDYGPSDRKEMKDYPKRIDSNALSHGKEIAKKLWEISEILMGVEFLSD
jgi:hypothetical protein